MCYYTLQVYKRAKNYLTLLLKIIVMKTLKQIKSAFKATFIDGNANSKQLVTTFIVTALPVIGIVVYFTT